MSTPDFEAIGRYTHACERFERALYARYDAVATLGRLMEQASVWIDQPAPVGFDPARCADLLARASEAHAELVAAMDEANHYATAAGKPPLGLR